ncbi:peptidylglycine monooxygenase [Candidimonas sp. SYP-B2681]|uniref:peptidylglycine monooxygenase n=1 Tax=Candidimonas sp. SYP-B2681 TaxID=2497686 RepID=UPI000F8777D2|nr:peptidylglycine monooxygenase [Candidimonas sp. SYP-B2681]RTZ48062.1 peptidylglycine monooxygenase [Candidimonas sp. SYP-B2681]
MEGLCDVFTLPDGRIGALRRKAPHILVFSPQGELQAQWVLPGVRCPHYATAGHDGQVYVVDLDGHQILVLDGDGTVQRVLGQPDKPSWGKPFNHPTSAHLAPDGTLYVTDGYGNSQVHRFDQAFNWLHTLGEPGRGPTQFSTPHAVRVLADQRVLVVDRENNRVQILTPDGGYLGELGDLHKPMALAVLQDGSILVTDHTPRLSRFRADGLLLGRARTFSTVAHGVAVGHDGSIFLAEMVPTMLTRLERVSATV